MREVGLHLDEEIGDVAVARGELLKLRLADAVLALEPLEALRELVERHEQLADHLFVHLVLRLHDAHRPLPVVRLDVLLLHELVPRRAHLHLVDAALAALGAVDDVAIGANLHRGAHPFAARELPVVRPEPVPHAPAGALVERPVPREPKLEARERAVHRLLNLRLRAVDVPEPELVNLAVEDGGGVVRVVDRADQHVCDDVARHGPLPLRPAQRAVDVNLGPPGAVRHSDVRVHPGRNLGRAPQTPRSHLAVEEHRPFSLNAHEVLPSPPTVVLAEDGTPEDKVVTPNGGLRLWFHPHLHREGFGSAKPEIGRRLELEESVMHRAKFERAP
mmetsp:Transcript_23831/g.77492  ORF Transcript_23831/g.77492 Transcript_23831/m.77492 type:complete len:332 (+) Transcript_23831:961-1956(+)